MAMTFVRDIADEDIRSMLGRHAGMNAVTTRYLIYAYAAISMCSLVNHFVR